MKTNRLRRFIVSLIRTNLNSHRLALGVAVGVLIGCTPFYGLHTIIAISLALLIPSLHRGTLLLGTAISLPPFLPIVAWVEYIIGSIFICPSDAMEYGAPLDALSSAYIQICLGSVCIGLLLAAVSYPLALWGARFVKTVMARRAQLRRRRRLIG